MRAAVARLKNPRLEVMVFTVGGARYGVEIGQVVGLIRDLPPRSEHVVPVESMLFEGREVPVFPASDFLATAPPARDKREVVVFDDGAGLYGMTVDSTDAVVEVTPGTDLYTFPPQEVCDGAPCRPWGFLTVGGRPVILLDMRTVLVH